MNTKYFSLLSASLLGVALINPAVASQAPNFYECTGKNTHLTLTVGSQQEIGIVPAVTIMSVQIGPKKFSFKDEDIITESTLIGDLWEASAETVPDLYVKYLTVVIPEIKLNEVPVSFKSQLIMTKVLTPINPDGVDGVLNASSYIDLSCRAAFVYF